MDGSQVLFQLDLFPTAVQTTPMQKISSTRGDAFVRHTDIGLALRRSSGSWTGATQLSQSAFTMNQAVDPTVIDAVFTKCDSQSPR